MTDAIIPKPIKILMVDKQQDANPSNLRAILEKSTLAHFKLRQAERLSAALILLMQQDFDLILLNLFLPDSQGLDSYLRICEHSPDVPVVIVADAEDRALALEVIREGAQDYVIKGSLASGYLERTLLYAIERHRYRSMLQNLSLRDELTGLLNRRGFLSLATQHLKIAQRSNWKVMLLFADLDGLKTINDNFGHPEGDEALRAVANILRQTFRASDTIARLGGDEFIALALKVSDAGMAAISNRLRANVQEYNEQNTRYQISLSFGVEQFNPQDKLTLENMISDVDKALYEDKKRRRGKKQ